MNQPGATVILSLRSVARGPWLTQLYALEDFTAAALAADVVPAPVPSRLASRLISRRRVRRGLARTRTPVVRPPQLNPDSYETLIAFSNDVFTFRDGFMELLNRIPQVAKRRILYLDESWSSDIRANPKAYQQAAGVFTHIFTTLPSAASLLAATTEVPVRAVPSSIDLKSLVPWSADPRPIDITWLGRKLSHQHESLLDWASTQRFYNYDATPPRDVTNFAEHRRALGNTLLNSNFWITNPARIDDPKRIEGAIEVGLRSYEALAAGCLMLGRLPREAEFFQKDFADLPGLVDFDIDSSQVPAQVTELLNDPAAIRTARTKHRLRGLERCDLAHGLQRILGEVGLSEVPAVTERIAYLQAEAARLRSGTD
ncbi:MAG: hypothetical protein K0U60_00500 [Actinomycetia bacterium]|nr:hypothetical protein [Actinomycetes bacterium]MCH9801028.1 hypothetical protein [Actinomycetes bacterium]